MLLFSIIFFAWNVYGFCMALKGLMLFLKQKVESVLLLSFIMLGVHTAILIGIFYILYHSF